VSIARQRLGVHVSATTNVDTLQQIAEKHCCLGSKCQRVHKQTVTTPSRDKSRPVEKSSAIPVWRRGRIPPP
jgi:hypothetical protein